MRPQIGKVKPWEEPPPPKNKPKKYLIIKLLHEWNDPNTYEVKSRWVYDKYEKTDLVIAHVHIHPTAEIVMWNLSEKKADMWLKIMGGNDG